MRKNSHTGSRLFLIEFLIVLFFFLIISSICLRMFAAGYQITEKAKALSKAQAQASSIAVLADMWGTGESAEEFADKLSESLGISREQFLDNQKNTENTENTDTLILAYREPEYRMEIRYAKEDTDQGIDQDTDPDTNKDINSVTDPKRIRILAIEKDDEILYEHDSIPMAPLTRGEVLS